MLLALMLTVEAQKSDMSGTNRRATNKALIRVGLPDTTSSSTSPSETEQQQRMNSQHMAVPDVTKERTPKMTQRQMRLPVRIEGTPAPPCDCAASNQSRLTIFQESPPRSGSTLMYGTLMVVFSHCIIRKEHFRLAEPHARHKGPWAHGGPIVTTVRDPLDSILSALSFLNQTNDHAALRLELSDVANLISDAKQPFDSKGCVNSSDRIVFKYEHFYKSPDALVDALESAFQCSAAAAARAEVRTRVFNISSMRAQTNAFTFKYRRTSRSPATGQWSPQLAGAHPRHISETLGEPHVPSDAQKRSILSHPNVKLLRSACGYS